MLGMMGFGGVVRFRGFTPSPLPLPQERVTIIATLIRPSDHLAISEQAWRRRTSPPAPLLTREGSDGLRPATADLQANGYCCKGIFNLSFTDMGPSLSFHTTRDGLHGTTSSSVSTVTHLASSGTFNNTMVENSFRPRIRD